MNSTSRQSKLIHIAKSQEARQGAMSLHRKIEIKKHNNKDVGLKFPEFQKRGTAQYQNPLLDNKNSDQRLSKMVAARVYGMGGQDKRQTRTSQVSKSTSNLKIKTFNQEVHEPSVQTPFTGEYYNDDSVNLEIFPRENDSKSLEQ